MRRQNINLYSQFNIPRQKIKHLSWKHMVMASAGFFSLLILMYVIALINLSYLKIKNYHTQEKLAQLESQLADAKSTYPAFFFTDNVAKVIDQLEKDLVVESHLLEKIANRVIFSNVLTSLSQVSTDNIWLTRILITDGGEKIQLSGNSISMNDLNLYLDKIQRDASFNGNHVSIDKIENTPKESYPGLLTFIVSVAKTHHEKPHQ